MNYTGIDYEGIRREAEREGIFLTDTEFLQVVHLCTRKIELNNLDADYMTLLLPDELKHYAFGRLINAISILRMEEKKNAANHRETVPCHRGKKFAFRIGRTRKGAPGRA